MLSRSATLRLDDASLKAATKLYINGLRGVTANSAAAERISEIFDLSCWLASESALARRTLVNAADASRSLAI